MRVDLAGMASHEIRTIVDRAITGDRHAAAILIDALAPVVRRRVSSALMRHDLRNRGTSADLDDLVQDTFAGLFNSRAIGAWDPERGLGLLGFVGLLAEREVGMAMRTRKRNPWSEEPIPHELLSDLGGATPSLAGHLEARDELRRLFAHARARLRGPARRYFEWLIVEDRSIQAVAEHTGSSAEALYAWRSRLLRLLRTLRRELAAAGQNSAPHRRAEAAQRDHHPARPRACRSTHCTSTIELG